MLEVSGISVAYGKHLAVDRITLGVAPGEIVLILGANGSGKTSLLKAIAGMLPAAGASIRLDGRELNGLPAHAIVEAGLALVPEGRGVFGELTVRENLELGAFAKRARPTEADNLRHVLELFPRLGERLSQAVRTMSGGEQQMVAVGRALMSAPMCKELFAALARIRDSRLGILLVEQNAKRSLAIADRGYLMANGRIVGEGSAASLREDPAVQRAYLGAGEPARTVPSPNGA